MDDEATRRFVKFEALCDRLATWLCDTEQAETGPAIAALLHVAGLLTIGEPDLQPDALGMLRSMQTRIEQALAATAQANSAIARARQPPAAPTAAAPRITPPDPA